MLTFLYLISLQIKFYLLSKKQRNTGLAVYYIHISIKHHKLLIKTHFYVYKYIKI